MTYILNFPYASTGKRGLQQKKEPGREEAKLALYDRKHSNLLLITTGPSSSGTPDREEDSSRPKFFHRSALPNKSTRNMRIYLRQTPWWTSAAQKTPKRYIATTTHIKTASHSTFTDAAIGEAFYSIYLPIGGAVWCSHVV